MHGLLKSLVGKTTIALLVALVVSFVVLLGIATQKLQKRSAESFEISSSTLTSYLAGQVNTGTRLKRASMVSGPVEAALQNPRMDLEAVRLVNVDGTEVLLERAASLPGA